MYAHSPQCTWWTKFNDANLYFVCIDETIACFNINGVGLSAAAEVLLRGSSRQLKCCWGPRVNLLLLNEGDVLTL